MFVAHYIFPGEPVCLFCKREFDEILLNASADETERIVKAFAEERKKADQRGQRRR